MSNETLESIDWLLAQKLDRASQKRFLESVKRQILLQPSVYPTRAQNRIISNMHRHFYRVSLPDYMQDVIKMYGDG